MNRTVLGGGLLALVLIALYFVFRPGAPPPHDGGDAARADGPQAAAASVGPVVFDLVTRQGKLVTGPAVLRVSQGDRVTIRVTSDVDEELHLHGYDLKVEIVKGVAASLSFTATLSGRFPYELEHSKAEIGALEVLPR